MTFDEKIERPTFLKVERLPSEVYGVAQRAYLMDVASDQTRYLSTCGLGFLHDLGILATLFCKLKRKIYRPSRNVGVSMFVLKFIFFNVLQDGAGFKRLASV